MNKTNDALGQQLWHALKGNEAIEIVERDDGFVGLSGGAKDYFAEFRHWPKRQKQAIRLAIRKGTRVLDIGCGAGRVALYLQEKGIEVVSIDNSPLASKYAGSEV